jgi:hypothetical protein
MKNLNRRDASKIVPIAILSSAVALLDGQLASADTTGTATEQQQQNQESMYEKSEPISQAPEATVPQTTPGATGDITEDEPVDPETESAAGQEMASESSLYAMNAEEIIGKKLVTSDGTELGEIDTLAKKPAEGESVYAVVTAGALLGMIGGEKVVVDLKDLTLVDDKLQTSAIQSEEQLKQQPQFNEEEYVKIEQTDRPISEFASSGTTQ